MGRPYTGGRAAAVLRQRRKAIAENEIGPQIFAAGQYTDGRPRPRDRARWLACKRDLAGFLKTYMPQAFPLAWSSDHMVVIDRLESAILHGGQAAVAMPRGSGKTTIMEGALCWAIGYGHRRYVVVVGAIKEAAESILASVRRELEDNPLLLADFPGMAVPISLLEGKPARARAQLCEGRTTKVKFTKSRLDLAAIRCDSSGAMIDALGLTGNLRGARRKMPDGSVQRPDFVFLDDPQTDESAKSPTQCATREDLITSSILGLAGPKTRIAAVMACTVIEPDDLSERILERPEWRGVRRSLVVSWPRCGRPDDKPSDEIPASRLLWRRYAELRRDGLAAGDDGQAATDFYTANREAMDAGAEMSWPDRYTAAEVSALQHAMNLYIDRGPDSFYSEYQNNPAEARKRQVRVLTARQVAAKTSGLPVRTAPDAAFVGAFADVNNYGAHWVIIAARGDMTGHIVDYGCYPATGRLVPKDSSKTETETAIYEGLAQLVQLLDQYQIKRTGNRQGIDAMLIDGGYTMETVFRLCGNLRPRFRLLPSRGVGSQKFSPRRSIGKPRNNCHLTEYQKKGQLVEHNSDWWRRETQEAFLTAVGSPGSLSLWGDEARIHDDYARQITAEYLQEYVKTKEGTEFYKWGRITGEKNDWLDATVGAWVCCCMLGADFSAAAVTPSITAQAKKISRRRSSKIRRE